MPKIIGLTIFPSKYPSFIQSMLSGCNKASLISVIKSSDSDNMPKIIHASGAEKKNIYIDTSKNIKVKNNPNFLLLGKFFLASFISSLTTHLRFV